MNLARRLAGAGVAAALCLAAWWSIRLARADWLGRQDSPEAVARAARLAPAHAGYPARLGDWRAAVARNPYDSASLIRLGLEAEGRGDLAQAERALLRAAEVDRLYEPGWSLANYYLRRQDWDPFWKWAKRAADTSPAPPRAVYSLCREATPDLGLVFDRLAPRGPRNLAAFLYWLGEQNDVAGLRAVLGRAVEMAGPGERDALLSCTRAALRLGAAADARRFWNRMIERGLLPFEKLDPESGASLTNGDFRQPPNGETFNWYLRPVAGVESRWRGPGQARFEFSGNQPERCDLLEQTVPVLPGRRYRLYWRHSVTGIVPWAGPVWVAGDSAGPPLPAANGAESWFEFTTPPAGDTILLRLEYRRVPGTTRVEGVLTLSEVRLQLAGPR
jgi:tetratricopeptide (TPR) repeat protein